MTDIKRVGDTGIHTIEGNIAGDLAASLSREREKQRQEYETQKNKIKSENKVMVGKINEKFSSAIDTAEQEFRRKTVGLVTAEEFRKANQEVGNAKKAHEEGQLFEKQKQFQKDLDEEAVRSKERQTKRKRALATLSFANDEENEGEEQEEEISFPVKKSLKNPNVDTSFLPDPRKEKEMELKKEELKKEWMEEQERIKQEVSFSLISLSFIFILIIF
jgi:protein FAM50